MRKWSDKRAVVAQTAATKSRPGVKITHDTGSLNWTQPRRANVEEAALPVRRNYPGRSCVVLARRIPYLIGVYHEIAVVDAYIISQEPRILVWRWNSMDYCAIVAANRSVRFYTIATI